jgi:UPF0755 protein
MKRWKYILLGIVLLAMIPIYFVNRYNNVLASPIGEGSAKTTFEIEAGMTGAQVIDELVAGGIVRESDVNYLKVYLRLNNVPPFQQGEFQIPANLTPSELFETLQHPEAPVVWVTIPEGLRKDEIADLLETELATDDRTNFDKAEFLRLTTDISFITALDLGMEGVVDLEGFLFPARYDIPVEYTESEIVQMLISAFKRRIGTVTYDQLIMASMVEREGYNDTDRPLIADVIAKRLNEGWLLQIDATLLYYHKDWDHEISLAVEKEIDHPYNTYLHTGLPATPICNPGVTAMNAVKDPKENPYYYYLHDENGKAYFGKTLAEHEANIANYLR